MTKVLIGLIGAVILALAQTSCSEPTPTAVEIDAAVFWLPQIPTGTLDPTDPTANIADAMIIDLLTSSLTTGRMDAGTRRYIGALAEMPTLSADGLTWTYRLRDGLMFTDGSPISAHTFEAAMRSWLGGGADLGPVRIRGAVEYAAGAHGWQEVGVAALNRLTLQITLEESAPKAVALETFALPLIHPDAPTTISGILDFPASGPYRPVEFIPGEMLILEQNWLYPNAFNHHIPRMILRLDAPPPDAVFLGNQNHVDRMLAPWFIFINTEHPEIAPIRDPNLRMALYYGLSRHLLEHLPMDVRPLSGFVPYGVWVGDPMDGLIPYQNLPMARVIRRGGYNPQLALHLFEEAFIANGEERIVISLTVFNEAEEWGRLAVAIRDWWMTLFGPERFHLLLRVISMEEAYASYAAGDFELGFGAFGHSAFDIWSTMAVWSARYPNAPRGFDNPEFDNIRHNALSNVNNHADRTAALLEMERLLFEQMPAIPLFQ